MLAGLGSRAALGAVLRAAREIRERGTFGFADEAASFAELNAFMQPASARDDSAG